MSSQLYSHQELRGSRIPVKNRQSLRNDVDKYNTVALQSHQNLKSFNFGQTSIAETPVRLNEPGRAKASKKVIANSFTSTVPRTTDNSQNNVGGMKKTETLESFQRFRQQKLEGKENEDALPPQGLPREAAQRGQQQQMSSASLHLTDQQVSSAYKKESDKMLATGGAGTAYLPSAGIEASQSFKADAFITSDNRQEEETRRLDPRDIGETDDDM